MKHEVKCSKCKVTIVDVGYRMPSSCINHIRERHPEDYERLVKAKNALQEIKDEYMDFWFEHYF